MLSRAQLGLLVALVAAGGCSLFLSEAAGDGDGDGDSDGGPDTCSFGDDSTCAGDAVCAADGRCVECTAHAQCPSTVCDREANTCVNPSQVVYVDSANTTPTQNCGAIDDPCENVPVGFGRAVASQRRFIRVDGTHFSAVGVDQEASANQPFVFVGPTASYQPNAGEAIAVNGGSAVFDGFAISGERHGAASTLPGIGCNGGTLIVRDVAIEGFGGVGIDTDDCEVFVDSSTVAGNTSGGVQLQNVGSFQIVNNVIVDNGSPGADLGGVEITDAAGAIARLDHNTIADNVRGADGWGVVCVNTSLVGRNNTITSADEATTDAVTGPCTWAHSNIQTPDSQPLPGDNNLAADPGFENGATNFRLRDGSALIDAGLAIEDLLTDRDGNLRVQGDAPDIGAYERMP